MNYDKPSVALRLADELDKTMDFQTRAWSAAKELRRLDEINGALLGHLQFAVKLLEGIPAINATAQVDAMRAAITKATAEAA